MTGWALEAAPNPRVLRLHVDAELTERTIETCPPAAAPPPLDRVLETVGVRSIDLHRYRARLNLVAGSDRSDVAATVGAVLDAAWGPPTALPSEEPPRAIAVDRRGPRLVAESPRMAADDPMLAAAFGVRGVAEAIVGEGLVLLRLGRLFRWTEVGPLAEAAVVGAERS